MYIVSLRYIRPLADIEAQLLAHIAYLEHYYAQGIFLLSGRKEPRDGSIIILRAPDRASVERIIQEDPFHQHQLAEYSITQFRRPKQRTRWNTCAKPSEPTPAPAGFSFGRYLYIQLSAGGVCKCAMTTVSRKGDQDKVRNRPDNRNGRLRCANRPNQSDLHTP